MLTLRSRGIDSSAVAFFDGSSLISMIVSERWPPPYPDAPFTRASEPISMIVCGLPGAAVERSVWPSTRPGDSLNALTTRLTSWKAATDVAPAARDARGGPPLRPRGRELRPAGVAAPPERRRARDPLPPVTAGNRAPALEEAVGLRAGQVAPPPPHHTRVGPFFDPAPADD